MPYNVVEGSDQCPSSKPYAVIGGKSGNDLFGCHTTKESARKQQQALYAAENRAHVPVSLPTTIAW